MDANNSNLVLSTPLMLTWGINKNVYDDSGRVSYDMSLQIPSGSYANPSTDLFFEKMKELESKFLEDTVKNSYEWMGKRKMSREVVEALFTPMLRYPKDKSTGEPDYSRGPCIKLKIPYWEGNFNTELYSQDGTPIFNKAIAETNTQPFEMFVPKTSRVACIISCNGFWFAGGKFGVTWKLVQAIVRPPTRIQNRCFITLSDDDHNQLSFVSQKEAEEAAATEVAEELAAEEFAMASADVADTDDSEDEEPTPPPKPVVKKKRRVVKRKTKSKKKTSDA